MHALMQVVDLLLTSVIPFTVPIVSQLAELRTQPGYRLELTESAYLPPHSVGWARRLCRGR